MADFIKDVLKYKKNHQGNIGKKYSNKFMSDFDLERIFFNGHAVCGN